MNVTISNEEAEDLVDTINDLADYVEESGHPLRADQGRETAEKLRKQICETHNRKETPKKPMNIEINCSEAQTLLERLAVLPECGIAQELYDRITLAVEMQDNYPVPSSMKTYDVDVCRTSYAFRTIRVEAETKADAISRAEDIAGNFTFSEKDAEYEADGAMIVEAIPSGRHDLDREPQPHGSLCASRVFGECTCGEFEMQLAAANEVVKAKPVKWNHLLDVAFAVANSPHENWEDVPYDDIIAALESRVKNLKLNREQGVDPFGFSDTYQESEVAT